MPPILIARTAITQYHRLGDLIQEMYLLTVRETRCESWRCLVSSGASFFALKETVFSL